MGPGGGLCGEGFGELVLFDLGLKGSGGCGDVSSVGILRYAQDDGNYRVAG